MKLINVGFGNLVSDIKIVSIVSPDSAPIKRLVHDAQDEGRLIDASFGRRTRSVIITESGHVVLSALTAETLRERNEGDEKADSEEEGEE